MTDLTPSPKLVELQARLDRIVRVGEVFANAIWWLYLAGLAWLAWVNRDSIGWDDVQFTLLFTVAGILALALVTFLLMGATHFWKGALVLGMIGGFAGQFWGCFTGVALAGLIGVVVLFVDTRPLREGARSRVFGATGATHQGNSRPS